MSLHPKYIRHIKQIVPFILIWLLFGSVYSLVEFGLLGSSKHYPATGNPYNFMSNLLYTVPATFVMGFIQGLIEVFWLRRRFENKSLWVKIVLKSTFYLGLIIVFLIALSTINSLQNNNEGIYSNAVVDEVSNFLKAFAFWSIVIYTGMALFFALFFSEISHYLGNSVLYNFLLGKYHTPKEETRIFMFLDMKSSTTIAEQIGHKKYFELIKAYYADMTNAILETSGEIYQYVGDEIVVSWTKQKGLRNNNCIKCFQKIQSIFETKTNHYKNLYGVKPDFKAGFHIGAVTTGEIGIIKKDIIYTGDILNTTARIQGECNTYNASLLISEELKSQLSKSNSFTTQEIGILLLRGKTESIQLNRIDF